MNKNENDTMSGRMTMDGGGAGGRPEWTGTMSGRTTADGEEGVVLAGRYRVVRRLGEGGMGSVWLAEDTKLDGKLFAIKMLPSVLAGKKGAYRQVKAEAMVAMKLSHPNIATVRVFEEDEGGNPFLVMDYIEGEGLDDILAEKGPLGEEETVRLLGPVAAALDYAHSQGVVHRDVKPGNVMERKDGTPFVLDFGIAREVQETMTRVTGKASSGTLLYMSPEQLRGRGPKPAQDVYSFAAMAYECLTGNPPFSRGQIEWQIVNEAPEALPESVGEGLRKGVMAGLSKEPGNRPGSCAGVLGRDEAEKRAREAQSVAKPAAKAAPAKEERGVWDGAYESEMREVGLPDGEKMRLHWCPAGRFTMGSPGTEEGRDDEETQHEVTLTRGFWMAETEVTQGQWKSLMNGETVKDLTKKALQDDTGYDFNDGMGAITMRERWGMKATDDPMNFCGDLDDNVPVYNVSWNEARDFCRRLTQKGHNEGWLPTAYRFRLPTEAEWEYACRAGTKTALPNGKEILIFGLHNVPALDDIAWYGGNSSVGFDGRGSNTEDWPEKQYPGGRAWARKVKGKERNRWGLYDMIGNVWEWCEDEYDWYPEGPVTDYWKRNDSTALDVHRVLRGGSWGSLARCCRSAGRDWEPAGCLGPCIGFRPVCSAGLSE